MTPIMPDRPNWASTIGLFIINFGTLDLLVQDYLENHLSAVQFAKWKDRHFAERVERIRKYIQHSKFPATKGKQFEQWSARLEPIRDIRNHIAHGLLRLSLAEDKKTLTLTVSLPRDLDSNNSPMARHLTFEDLLTRSKELVDLTEEFQAWAGNWVTEVEMKF